MSTGILSAMTFTLKVRLHSSCFLQFACINIEHPGKYVYISPATSFLKGRVKGHWYRGKEVGDSSMSQYHDVFQVISGRGQYVGHVTNKMWPLSEEYTNHLVRMQQVHVHKIHIIMSLNQDFWGFQTACFET